MSLQLHIGLLIIISGHSSSHEIIFQNATALLRDRCWQGERWSVIRVE